MSTSDRNIGPVLVVDDEAILVWELTDRLSESGWQTLDAPDASRAMAIIEDVPELHALVTDVQMPGELDGLDLAHWARSRSDDLLIIVISAHARWQSFELPRDAHFLSKPLNYGKLSAILSDALPASD